MAHKSDLDIALSKKIRSLSTREEKIYADMKLSDKNVSSEFASECMNVLSEISSDVLSASIEELQQKLVRIAELKKYISQANIGKREKTTLLSNAEKIHAAIKKDVSGKNNILKKASSAIGNIAGRVDSETVMTTLFGDDEAGKIMSMASKGVLNVGKFAAGKIKESAAKRKENRAVLKRDALSIVDRAKKPTRALPLPQPFATDTDSSAPRLMTGSGGSSGGSSIELKSVESLLSIISNDVKHIIQILDVNQDKEDESRLDAIEDSIEKKNQGTGGGTSTPVPEEKKSFLSFLAENAPWLLKAGGLAGLAALAFEGLDEEIKNQIKKGIDDSLSVMDTLGRTGAKAALDMGKDAIGLPDLDITALPPEGAAARGRAAGVKYSERFKKPTGNALSKVNGLKPPEVKIPKAPGVASKAAFLGKEVSKDLGRSVLGRASLSPLKLVRGMPLVSGGLSGMERYSEGQDVAQIALGVAAETAGGAAGAWGGAAAGAAAGMVLGPVGAAIGGVIGGLIGGIGGSYLGGAVADTAYEKLAEDSQEATEESTKASEELKKSQEKLQQSVDNLNKSMSFGPGYQLGPAPDTAPGVGTPLPDVAQSTQLENSTNTTIPVKMSQAAGDTELLDISDPKNRIGQAFAGGKTHEGTLALASAIMGSMGSDVNRFTAFNDKEHQGTLSVHPYGLGIDFSIKDPKKSPQVKKELEKMLSDFGVRGEVIDEYLHPSPGSTGKHIHVGLSSKDDAEKFLKEYNNRSKGTAVPKDKAVPVQAGSGASMKENAPTPAPISVYEISAPTATTTPNNSGAREPMSQPTPAPIAFATPMVPGT